MLFFPWLSHWDSFQVGFCVLLTCYSSIILLPPFLFLHCKVKSHFLPFCSSSLMVRNRAIINPIFFLFTWLVSLCVINLPYLLYLLPTKFYWSFRDPSCGIPPHPPQIPTLYSMVHLFMGTLFSLFRL